MKKIFPLLVLLLISILFFYKIFIFFQVPFPGDLLISTYSPWKYESYLGYNPGSYPDKAQYFDVIRQLYPWKILAIDQWKNGQIPLWNPYNFSGAPLLANNQSSVFYPANLLFFFVNYSIAWAFYIFIQPLLASIFMYLFIRSLKLSIIAALVASISYAYSLFMTTFLEYGNFGHTILWLPLLLYFIEKLKSTGSQFFLVGISFVLAAVIFAGHLQIASGVLLFTLLYGAVRLYKTRKKLLLFVVSFVLGLGISAIQILPTLELLTLSARVPHPPGIINNLFLLKPEQVILFFVPDFYGNPVTRNYLLADTYPGNAVYIGVIPVLFFLSAFFKKKKEFVLKFFIVVSSLLFLLSIKNPISEFIFNLPLFSASSPSNYFFLLAFCISVIAAFGVNIKLTFKKNVTVVVLTSLTILFFVLLNTFQNIEFNEKQTLLSILIVLVSIGGFFAFRYLKWKYILVLPLLILSLELFYFFIKFNPFVPPELMYPKTTITSYLKENIDVERFIGYRAANIESNFSTHFRILSPDGYDPLYPIIYSDYTDSSSRSDVLVKLDQEKIIDSLGVRYILDRVENGSDQNTFDTSKFTSIYRVDGWSIYENNSALPRAYILNQNNIAPANIIEYTPNKVIIENDQGAAGLLVLTDTYYPGWIVTVNEEGKEVKKHDGIFRSVEVSENDKNISFEYKPQSFYKGLIITIISIIGVVLVFFLQKVLWRK